MTWQREHHLHHDQPTGTTPCWVMVGRWAILSSVRGYRVAGVAVVRPSRGPDSHADPAPTVAVPHGALAALWTVLLHRGALVEAPRGGSRTRRAAGQRMSVTATTDPQDGGGGSDLRSPYPGNARS